jgi:hypothetical protein
MRLGESGLDARNAIVGVVSVMLAAAGCAGETPVATPPKPGLYAGASREAVVYEVVASKDGDLDVVARFPGGLSSELFIEDGAERFVSSVEGPVTASPSGPGEPWVVACEAGCELRYHFDLPAAALRFGDVGYAMEVPGAILAPPSTFLLRPAAGDLSRRFELHVTVPEGQRFVSGIPPIDDRGTVAATLADLPMTPYSAIGEMRVHGIDEMGGHVDVAVIGPPIDRGDEVVVDWAREGFLNVATLLGDRPSDHALVLIDVRSGGRFSLLTTLGNGGSSIHAPVGHAVRPEPLARDWRMTHEFVHVGTPGMARRHDWLGEGLATYLEPLARLARGKIDAQEVWGDLFRSLHQGLPEPGDQGLDRTPTWGRKYWGGALFCLLADVQAHQRTHNERSLVDAIRAVHAAGGTVSARWTMNRFVEVGDRAIGAPVLAELYAAHANEPVQVDLDALFRDLGVRAGPGRSVVFDDGAPLADVRRAITTSAGPRPGRGGVTEAPGSDRSPPR